MDSGGRFFATFFEAPAGHPLDLPLNDGRRWTERNAFFYYRSDLRWAAQSTGWDFAYIGKWRHPRGQRMVEFRRPEPPAPPTLPRRAVRRVSPRLKRPVKRALKSLT
jgi:hypothetical protein